MMKTKTLIMLCCLLTANSILAQVTTTVAYKYDEFNRLKETSDGTNTIVYTYDALGNRTQESVSVTLSTSENKILGLKLYPNPTPKKVSILSKNTIDKVIIYDLIGKLVKEVKNMKSSVDINISNFSAGIYYFTVFSNGKKQSLKVVKQ